MTDTIDYASVDVPADKDPQEYHYTERRAEILQLVERAGSPARINQSNLANRYGVAQSQISQDLDRLAEFVEDSLGQRATLTTRTMFKRVVDDLLDEDDWRAKAKAFDIVMEWNEWLQDIGEQHREPDRVEADVREQSAEIQYQVVRGDEADVPGGATGGQADYDALGFSAAPGGEVDVNAVEQVGDGDE